MNYNKAQTLAEYALLITIIVAAIAGMQIYVKRGLQAKYKSFVDGTGNMVGIKQYEPYYNQSEEIIDLEYVTTYTYKQEGRLTRETDHAVTRGVTVTEGFDIGADDEWF